MEAPPWGDLAGGLGRESNLHAFKHLHLLFHGLQAAPSEKSPSHVMLSPCAGLLPQSHGFQRGDWLLVTFPPTGTPGISVTTRGDVSVEAEVVNITPPPGQGILVRMVGELGRNAGAGPEIQMTSELTWNKSHVTLAASSSSRGLCAFVPAYHLPLPVRPCLAAPHLSKVRSSTRRPAESIVWRTMSLWAAS